MSSEPPLRLFTEPSLVPDAWTYFRDVQTKDRQYESFITETDPPPTDLNADIMATYRPLLEPYYFDETRFDTYLEQLGVDYPQLEDPEAE